MKVLAVALVLLLGVSVAAGAGVALRGSDGPTDWEQGTSKVRGLTWFWVRAPDKEYTLFYTGVVWMCYNSDSPDNAGYNPWWHFTLWKTGYKDASGNFVPLPEPQMLFEQQNGSYSSARSYNLETLWDNWENTKTDKTQCLGEFEWRLDILPYNSSIPMKTFYRRFKMDSVTQAQGPVADAGNQMPAGGGPAATDEPGFWENLFVPSDIKLEEVKAKLLNWLNLLPLEIITTFKDALANQDDYFGEATVDPNTGIETKRVLHWGGVNLGFVTLQYDMDITTMMPYLKWMRMLLGMSLWVTFAFATWKRFSRVVS